MGAIALLFMRYRSAPTRERKQIRWVLLAGVMAILLGSIGFVLPEFGVIPPPGHEFSVLIVVSALIPMLLIPASVVVAVLEPAWIDVDIVVRRSIVYGALSFVILLVYIGAVSAFGVAGTRLGLGIETAVVVTVLAAVLFQPARRRLQAVADRRVRACPRYEAVAEFGDARTGRRTHRVAAPTGRNHPASHSPDLGAGHPRRRHTSRSRTSGRRAALRVPLGAGDEQVGEIICGPKTEGAIHEDDIQLVRTLAGQLGLALMNARLAGRIVNAAESERRRIERNIHDGGQQELVALRCWEWPDRPPLRGASVLAR